MTGKNDNRKLLSEKNGNTWFGHAICSCVYAVQSCTFALTCGHVAGVAVFDCCLGHWSVDASTVNQDLV